MTEHVKTGLMKLVMQGGGVEPGLGTETDSAVVTERFSIRARISLLQFCPSLQRHSSQVT
jgi:hypothetical protein